MDDTYYMQAALEEARIAKSHGDWPFGAVVVHKDTIVGRGYCTNNTTGDVTDHAEIRALKEACHNLKRNELGDCVIYCTNEPCLMCASAIFQAKTPRIIMGLRRSDLPMLLRPRKITIETLLDDVGYEVYITSGVLYDQILEEFSELQKK